MSGEIVPRKNWQIRQPEQNPQALEPQVVRGEIVQTGTVVEHRTQMVEVPASCRVIKVGGELFQIDPAQLMRMIKQITQTIGEYKAMENAYGRYIIPALRKARSDMVSDLENNFGIHWEIDASGSSRFFKS